MPVVIWQHYRVSNREADIHCSSAQVTSLHSEILAIVNRAFLRCVADPAEEAAFRGGGLRGAVDKEVSKILARYMLST